MTNLRARNILGGLICGAIMSAVGAYYVLSKVYFVLTSSSVDAVVVEVSHEWVPAGRGSRMAYVPTVEIASETKRIKLDSWNETPVYSVGSPISILCSRSDNHYCVEDNFFSLFFYPALFMMIGVAAFGLSLYFKRLG